MEYSCKKTKRKYRIKFLYSSLLLQAVCHHSAYVHILWQGVRLVRRCCGSRGQGGDLVAAAAALSVAMAQGRTAEELELLSSLFNMLGENLATLAIKAPSSEDCRQKNQDCCP